MKRQSYYPVFLNLSGRRCVVIGGGLIAQRKVNTLLSSGAQITLISPTLTRRLASLAARGTIQHVARRFRAADLRGAWLVCAATDDERINRAVFEAASRRRVFANVVDQPHLCSFIAPAIFRRDPLTIAVSTGGASPTVAKKLRHELGRTVGPEYSSLLRMLESLRGVAKRTLPTYNDRKRYFSELVSTGPVVGLIRSGKRAQAKHEALRLLRKFNHQ